MRLTNNELEFMTILWNADEPLTSTEILKNAVDKTWKDTSLHTLLNKLLQKDAIKEAGYKKDGKAISRLFEPTITCDEYYANLFEANKRTTANTIPMIFSALIKNEDLDMDTINKLEDIIRKRKEEL